MKGQVKKEIQIIYPELSYQLNGIFFKIHKEHGRYCREKQYSDALEKEFKEKNIKFFREKKIDKIFQFTGNICDFIVEDCIIIDVKAKKFISKEDFYQMKRYLMSSNNKLGLIVNFRDDFIKTKRVLNGNC